MLDPDPPVLAQKYRLIRQLEVGGMGSVWLAEHVHLDSQVAVKLMSKELAATPAGMQRFLREARMAASLRSPHVVQILDYGVHEGTPFIAMELLEGESLAARLDREGRFPSWEQAERVLRYIARAVGRAHDAGIIHRDLKPANIFLVRDEEEEVVKLLDFGIAKTTLPGASPESNTRTGEFLGSPAYASPEQLQASKTLDQRADIWSFGVIAYECLLGRPPFSADTLVGQVLAICMDPLPVPSRSGPVPAGFDAWFARACARDVEQRFASVREASAELRRLCAHAPPLAPELESLAALQTPSSAPATLRQAAFSTPVPPDARAHPARRSEATRRLAAPRLPSLRRRGIAKWLAALTLLAVVPLLLIALRAPASRAPIDSTLSGLTPGATNELGRSEPKHAEPGHGEPTPGDDVGGRNAAPPQDVPAAPVAAAQPAAPSGHAPSALPEPSPSLASVPAPARSKKPSASAAAQRRSGAWLTITASAPSSVLLDGTALGTTPLADVAIASGVHEIAFLHDGERSAQIVELRAGEHKRIDARLGVARGDGLDETSVQRTVRSYGSAVRDDCWQRQLSARAPGDPTSVRVTATIDVEPSGRVASVATSGAPAAYPELSRCIEAKLRAWRFPSARGATVVNVPFVFVTE